MNGDGIRGGSVMEGLERCDTIERFIGIRPSPPVTGTSAVLRRQIVTDDTSGRIGRLRHPPAATLTTASLAVITTWEVGHAGVMPLNRAQPSTSPQSESEDEGLEPTAEIVFRVSSARASSRACLREMSMPPPSGHGTCASWHPVWR
jgi:hypothetical protein